MINSVVEIFNRTVSEHGKKTAAIDPVRSVTWEELQKEAFCFADLIDSVTETGKTGFPVAVFANKSVSLLSCITGVICSGGFYVYINPELTNARIETVLSVLEPACVLTEDALISRMKGITEKYRTIPFSEASGRNQDRNYTPRKDINRETPLYGMFTSGSTGVPKCVLVPHGAAMDFILHFTGIFGFTSDDVIGNQAPFDFDVSIKDIVTAFFTGAALVLIPTEYFVTPARLLDYLIDNNVTSLTWAVSALCLVSGLKGFTYKVPDKIKRVMFSGEVMPMKQLAIWQENLPDAKFVNLYGPSEITCNCTYYELNRRYSLDEKLPIGRPFPGRTVRLLDSDGAEITAPGVTGEICVCGESLAIGYYRDEEQTNKAFVTYKDKNGNECRMYKSGDLAFIGDDGELYFAGRKDFQIKHMGHRIELEEIEGHINSVEGVERSVCAFDASHDRLSAFYTGTIGKTELHGILKETLPLFMIPGKIAHVKKFVIGKNGKLDRKSLSELETVE
ncbi:MAG: AMP-binding protein [Lachnospiraceae bacterium]|nr:AMP-binding protein [Lachnospiraceae bacterium]